MFRFLIAGLSYPGYPFLLAYLQVVALATPENSHVFCALAGSESPPSR